MEKITSLAKNLKNSALGTPHLRHLTLIEGEMFGWDHTACAITYNPHDTNYEAYLLHEFGHATLDHKHYKTDIELLQMERAAWDEALRLAPTYRIELHPDLIEDSLDTYRDWLHSRACCPRCSATGIQTAPSLYACLACHSEWHVNDARSCALRRYHIKKRS